MDLENFIAFHLVVGRMAGLIAKRIAQIGLNASAYACDVIANTECASDCQAEVPL